MTEKHVFDDLDALRSAGARDEKTRRVKSAKSRKRKGKRIQGEFYQVSLSWADKAAEVSGGYLILALRIHRAWRMRKKGSSTIAVTTKVLAGSGRPVGSRRWKQARLRIVRRLEAAKLIRVVTRRPGCAAQVRVMDRDLTRTYIGSM